MKKPKVKFLCSWQKFHEKVNFSPQNPTFPEKSVFCPPKFLMTFLVVSSDFSNFHPVFVKSYRKSLLIPYFYAETTGNNAFSGEMWNTQEKPKDF